jgi:hypothetical protein
LFREPGIAPYRYSPVDEEANELRLMIVKKVICCHITADADYVAYTYF